MIAVAVFAMTAVLILAFLVAGVLEIGPCDHFEGRDERWDW